MYTYTSFYKNLKHVDIKELLAKQFTINVKLHQVADLKYYQIITMKD